MLSVLEQNPEIKWNQLIGQIEVEPEISTDVESTKDESLLTDDSIDNELTSFKL